MESGLKKKMDGKGQPDRRLSDGGIQKARSNRNLFGSVVYWAGNRSGGGTGFPERYVSVRLLL